MYKITLVAKNLLYTVSNRLMNWYKCLNFKPYLYDLRMLYWLGISK